MTTATETIKPQLPLALAERIADELLERFSPYCQRLEVVGSVRRRKMTVKDIELLAIPAYREFAADLFGERMTRIDLLDEYARDMLAEGVWLHPRLDKNDRPAVGDKYKRLLYAPLAGGPPVALDLFTADASNWGLAQLIRTGPWQFSKRAVTPQHQGGLLPFGYGVRDGMRLWRGDKSIETPDEQSVFDVLGMAYVAPEERI